jgi:hypothetical protein
MVYSILALTSVGARRTRSSVSTLMPMPMMFASFTSRHQIDSSSGDLPANGQPEESPNPRASSDRAISSGYKSSFWTWMQFSDLSFSVAPSAIG